MVPPKSKIWKYFTKQNKTNVQCNTCLKILKSSGNTSNLVAHLRQKHLKLFKAAFDNTLNSEENVGVAALEVSIH